MDAIMSLRSAILGLLTTEPMNGYAIKTLFDEAINFIWETAPVLLRLHSR